MMAAAGLASCERGPAPRVTSSQPNGAATDRRVERVDSAAPPAVDDEPEAAASRPADDVPPFIDVLERIAFDRPGRIRAEPKGANVVEIATENVQRLRIRNDEFPISGEGSVILRIDGSVREWLRKQPALELRRTPAGDWVTPEPTRP